MKDFTILGTVVKIDDRYFVKTDMMAEQLEILGYRGGEQVYITIKCVNNEQ